MHNNDQHSYREGYSFRSYAPPSPSGFMKFLWWLCGVDRQILSRATYSEHVKYACMGAIVLGTCIVASISMGFAVHTIWLSLTLAIPAGLFWGSLIGALERFIISSTGIGDGTSDITWKEFKNALPRLALSFVIGVCVSEPLLLFMFQPEINKVFKQKAELVAKRTGEEFDKSEEAKDLQLKINEFQKEKDENSKQASENDRLAAAENTTEKGGCGPKCQEFKVRADMFRGAAKINGDSITMYMAKKNTLRKAAADKAKTIATERPGMLEQMTTLHSIEEAQTPMLWIRGFFVLIDITPIFFKLMLSIGSYFYLSKMVELLLLAGYGVQRKEGYTKTEGKGAGSEGEFLDKVDFHEVDMLNSVKRRAINIQRKLSHIALSLYDKRKKQEIADNPEQFIKENPSK